jgi:hypothetical protein
VELCDVVPKSRRRIVAIQLRRDHLEVGLIVRVLGESQHRRAVFRLVVVGQQNCVMREVLIRGHLDISHREIKIASRSPSRRVGELLSYRPNDFRSLGKTEEIYKTAISRSRRVEEGSGSLVRIGQKPVEEEPELISPL